MSHHCKALIIHCMDFRLGSATKAYLEQNNLLNDCDVVSVAGAAKSLVSPAKESDREFLMRQIGLSQKLHGIGEVVLMNHTDCGAYGGRAAFASRDEERKKHSDDLRAAAEVIKKENPSLAVRTLVADIEDSGKIEIKNV